MSDRVIVGDHENKMMNQMIEEPPTMETNLDLTLSLSLGNNNVVVRESSSNLRFKSLKAYDDSRVAPKHQFPCKFCDKKFPTTQALGGHQNGHRRERFLSKVRKEIDHLNFSGLGAHRLCPYQAMAINHLPLSPRYHGANMQPVSQMSSTPWGHFGPGYGNQAGLHRRSLSAHQFGTTSNFLGESAETPILHRGNVEFSYDLDDFSSLLATDAARRARIARADLGGRK